MQMPTSDQYMKQYRRFKQQRPDYVLFFRIGDFYETFDDDARLAHRVLGIALTHRADGTALAGVPYHTVERYLSRMIQAGHRVALCEYQPDEATRTTPQENRA